MKPTHFILIFFAVVFALSSCVIREPEDKSVLTKGGFQMFMQVENDILEQTRLFDKVLLVSNYMSTPDSLKWKFHLANFELFNLKFKQNTCSFMNSNNDTLYTIITSSKSINTVDSEWLIKEHYSSYFLRVKCTQKNQWKMSVYKTDSLYSYYLNSSNLELTCTDTIAPIRYTNANFDIRGNASLVENNYRYPVVLDYSISEVLKHTSISTSIYQGTINIEASDSISNKKSKAICRFLMTEAPSVEISFNGITSIYKDWNFDLSEYDF